MLTVKYTVKEQDFRSAMYFPLLLRYKRVLYLLALTVAGSLACFICSRFGVFPDAFIVYFIAIAYIFAVAFVFGRAEQSMRRYLRTPNCLIGREFTFTLDKKTARFVIEADKVDEQFYLKDFTMVVDLRRILFFHLQGDQVYVVPKRAFTEEEYLRATDLLTKAIGGNFTYMRLLPWRKPGYLK